MIEILELKIKDFNMAIANIFKDLKENIDTMSNNIGTPS